ncbi:MAG: alpha-L-fucosidase [Bacteroidetes bacterium]|nr:alpha-L-fucosidase [Bacteroidota bacterium]
MHYKTILFSLLFYPSILFSQANYIPSQGNLEAREWFANAKFGLFIHWGPFSILGDGEWVMNNRNISVKNYTHLMDFFNPINFDAHAWVSLAKQSGMKYITLITRHHDGFSMWDTKYSDFNIMNTPYHKDIVKMIADECHKQGIKLFLYYSILDWRRDDYSWTTGRTGQGTGRTVQGAWDNYIQFMENQLTELLTHYGDIAGIWFDGYWDQTAPEGAVDRQPRIDWHLSEIYALIHRIQPNCLIGNNHHLDPIPGEDFQMFEKDLPGQNNSGLSFQKPSEKLPLETCETINNSWGYNITDTTYKSTTQLIQLLVHAASLGANLLLNIGPMPNGEIQPEFQDRLHAIGDWLHVNANSIYQTQAGYLKPQDWGCITQTKDKIYLHIFNSNTTKISLKDFPFQHINKVYFLANNESISYTLNKQQFEINNLSIKPGNPDVVIVVESSVK